MALIQWKVSATDHAAGPAMASRTPITVRPFKVIEGFFTDCFASIHVLEFDQGNPPL